MTFTKLDAEGKPLRPAIVWLDQRQLNTVRRAVEFACVEWPMLSPHTHIIVALTMHRSPKGWWSADEVAAMVMTSDYLPCQSLFEMRLLRDLVEQRRYFIKPLNYDGDPSNYPNVVLTDVAAGECAMEIVVGEGADASKRRLRADELKEQGKPCWIWMAEEQERPPPLPLAQRHRPTQINPEPKQDSTTPRTRTTPESRTAPNEQMSFGALAEAPTTHVTATPPANDSQLPASAQPP